MGGSDGFSEPDPADTDDVPEQSEIIGEVRDGSRSCGDCAHRQVCKIVDGFGQMISQRGGDPDELPVDPEDLAVICDEYEENSDDDGDEDGDYVFDPKVV